MNFDVLFRIKIFTLQRETLHAQTGLAMAAPTSSVLSELYIEYLEHTSIIDPLIKCRITGYSTYVDDIPLIYKPTCTNINEYLHELNDQCPQV